jgi:hypothetical protein
VDLSSGHDPAVGSYEHADEISLSIKGRKFLYRPGKDSFPKENSDPRSWTIFKGKWISFDLNFTH